MIYLIITACIQNWYGIQNAEKRKQEYLSAITETLSHLPSAIQPIIVENNGKRLTYLDEFQHNDTFVPVLYTTNNKRYLTHKGMIELLDIKEVIQTYHIEEDDIIIKVTGRYTVKSPLFFATVLDDTARTDAFVAFLNAHTMQWDPYDCVLGLYACTAALLLGWSHLTINYSSAEVAFAQHIRKYAQHIHEMSVLDVECTFADTGRKVRI